MLDTRQRLITDIRRNHDKPDVIMTKIRRDRSDAGGLETGWRGGGRAG